jgi:hypothetical protein
MLVSWSFFYRIHRFHLDEMPHLYFFINFFTYHKKSYVIIYLLKIKLSLKLT